MRMRRESLVRRLLREVHGQAMIMVALGTVSFIGVAGVATDLGHAYFLRQQLQASTNTAVLAAAGALGANGTVAAATADAALFSSAPGGKNALSGLQNVTETPTFLCLSTLSTNMELPCVTYSGGGSGTNAISVVQTAKIPLWFGGMFGIPAFNISTKATAAISGGTGTPYNVAIILDRTGSMSNSDGGAQCSGTQETCALQGMQSLLLTLHPCATGQDCTQTSSASVDTVALFGFPPALTTQVQGSDSPCFSTDLTAETYTFQNVTTGLLDLPTTETYQIIPKSAGTFFAFDYRTTDLATTLNTTSALVQAVGGKSGCTGLQAVSGGGSGTYYAQWVYMAQEALKAQQLLNPGSQNAMIILGDGDSWADSSHVTAVTGTVNGVSGATVNSYTYPSVKGQCGQAIDAANAIATSTTLNNPGSFTKIFTIAYGAYSKSGSGTGEGCRTDVTYSSHVGVSPCTTLQDMASDSTYFFSDGTNGCTSPNAITKLSDIFKAIGGDLTHPRLIPNGTT